MWQHGRLPKADAADAPFDSDLLVTLYVPTAEFERLPPVLRRGESLAVHVTLFSQVIMITTVIS